MSCSHRVHCLGAFVRMRSENAAFSRDGVLIDTRCRYSAGVRSSKLEGRTASRFVTSEVLQHAAISYDQSNRTHVN